MNNQKALQGNFYSELKLIFLQSKQIDFMVVLSSFARHYIDIQDIHINFPLFWYHWQREGIKSDIANPIGINIHIHLPLHSHTTSTYTFIFFWKRLFNHIHLFVFPFKLRHTCARLCILLWIIFIPLISLFAFIKWMKCW
jgi:hypothetical protein